MTIVTTTANIIVEVATIHDLPALMALFSRYHQSLNQDANLPEIKHYLEWCLINHETALFIAKQAEPSLGREDSCALGFVQIVPGYSAKKLRCQWEATDLYVLPEAPAEAIAQQLTDAARHWVEQMGDGWYAAT